MTKRLTIAALFLICFTVPAWAQESVPKAEVFGGFSLLSARLGAPDRQQSFGWQASIAGNPTKVFGLVADFGGQYKTTTGPNINIHDFLFGPQYNFRMKKMKVFAHTLFGVVRLDNGFDTETKFAMGYGGGLDMKAHSVSIRVVQFDWVPVQVNDPGKTWASDPLRFGFGVVIPIGKK